MSEAVLSTSPTRVVEVDPARLERWISGFTERHGVPERSPGADPVAVPFVLAAPDGAVAEVLAWAPGRVDLPGRLGLVLLRRGGYAVGLGVGEQLTDHYCGTRYVQSRTAAGGWSQQRYARRRGNQADALVGRVVEQAADRLLGPRGALVDGLVVGGDRSLVRQVLQDPGLAPLTGLPRREFYDVTDPRLKVLQETLRRARATRIRLREPG
ncbi:acVLRF1 family peptidyl-tRNA hydrolase [Ornithinimicrobium cavernae]|uniref:acVLRF1 family peptidyl-tRNA hydrolase n=1 Tax=Ornithinimicrobium cavernae TaxID=2666047 RepID=UPI000D698786|nr:acVLRF1 family peptidyl-tRNA hydrolase [Ornithinimicrobium cavernae]